MKTIYQGFDKLDLAIDGDISTDFLEKLEKAQERAKDQKLGKVLLEYKGVQMHVGDSGAKGGYAFRCDTGPLGAIWKFKRPNAGPWGIFVNVRAAALAVYGLGEVRTDLNAFLDAIGAILVPNGISINRIDYAIDFLVPGFVLDPENFVMHSRTNRSDREEVELVEERHSNGNSGRYTSVTVGKMPCRQVIVYDKRKEVIDKKTPHWWEIWNAHCKAKGLPELDPKDREGSQIWRVEVRAGKQELKRKWGIATWMDMFDKIGDVFLRALADIRYVVPGDDSNRARLPNHPLWDTVEGHLRADLFEMIAHVEPGVIKTVHRRQKIKELEALVIGLSATLAEARGIKGDGLELLPGLVSAAIQRFMRSEPEKFSKKLERAQQRYVFL